MKIIPAIQKLQREVRAQAITAGVGIGVERTPTGTRIYVKDDGVGDDGGWHGMFELAARVDANAGPPVYKVKVFNGNDPESVTAGMAHVNRQPFQVATMEATIAATGRHYVYLEFKAPVEATESTPAVPATVAAVVKTALMESNWHVVYHLLGQAWVENGTIRLSQDHIPGNVYMDWYGPCLGLLETEDD